MLAVGFVLVIVLGYVNADDRPTGYLFYTAEVINLDSNLTSYTVGCTVNSTGSLGADANSRNLTILDSRQTPYATEIINDTTILHTVDLRNNDESTVCGVKTYFCKLNRSLIAMRTIRIARPPPVIKPSEFKCISYNRKRLVCQFPRRNSCGLSTKYNLSMIRLNRQSTCNLTDDYTTLSFDSDSETCVFSSGHRNISFRIEAENIVGKTESTYPVDHYDNVKPENPNNLQVSSVDVSRVSIVWEMSNMLYNLDRSIEVEFQLITKYDVRTSFMKMNLTDIKDKQMVHQFNDLYAFTSYELKMRARVVPKAVRNFEDEYWSEWSSIEFQTLACRPYEAPRILPGAYSFKETRDDLVVIEVYWEQIPEYRHNGPGFGYEIYALSQSGHKITTNASNNGVATFQKAIHGEQYTVYLSSHNEKGRSEEVNVIHVYPHKTVYQPKVKRLFQNESYHLQWFPVEDMEDLTNYTVMYCSYSTTGSCHGAIKFDTLPAKATSYFLNSNKTLSFALAANYRGYSSELVWFLCTVSSTNSISQLSFDLTDVTENSITVRMKLSCMDQSLVERYVVSYWPKQGHDTIKNHSYQPYEMVFPIYGLLVDTDYEVVVTAYDEKGYAYESRNSIRTKSKDILMQLILFLLFGILVMGFMTTTAARRVKKMMNIKVEMPIGLLGIDEMPNEVKSIHESEPLTVRSNSTIELVELPPKECQPFVEEEPIKVHETLADLCSDAIELEELPPSTYQPTNVQVKSILKKPDQSLDPPQLNHVDKPKPTVQIVTGNSYIKPAQMSGMKDPAEPSPFIEDNRTSGGSPGYVDVNLMMKQHQMVR